MMTRRKNGRKLGGRGKWDGGGRGICLPFELSLKCMSLCKRLRESCLLWPTSHNLLKIVLHFRVGNSASRERDEVEVDKKSPVRAKKVDS